MKNDTEKKSKKSSMFNKKEKRAVAEVEVDDPEFGGRRVSEKLNVNMAQEIAEAVGTVSEEGKSPEEILREKMIEAEISEKQESEAKKSEIEKAKPLGGALGFVGEVLEPGEKIAVMDVVKKPVSFGMMFFIILFVFVGGWAAFAPLNSAAVASGKVVLDANKKLVQHLEGGIIETLHVRDGDTVEAGDLLVTIDKTKARANWEILSGQLIVTEALEDRLLSQRDGKEHIEFRSSLLDAASSNPGVKKNLDVQTRLFVSRNDVLAGQIAVLKQRIKQFKDEIAGLNAQRDATDKQLALINEEIESVQILVKEGLAQRPRLLSLQREGARLLGSHGEFTALIARAGQSITENELSILNLQNERANEIVSELRQVQTEMGDLRERVRAAIDVLDRTEVVAPRSGIITNMHFHTKGGVVQPGQELLSIIPQDDELLLEAMVKITDIDLVHAGLEANVRLSAYKARTAPMLVGEVISVSPDSLVDERTGAPYYRARVRIFDDSLAKLGSDTPLYPGMPAEVLIVTGSKTPLGYLLDPLIAFINKSWRED